ncbi:MAG: 2-dehydro-3-deoxygalactonokinase [Pseudomonadota bacterium]|nr:2-dehydro-3-deoxygalactonokinase [Pseudomonadota bacterium]
MKPPSDTALIGIDWGTTAARAYRIDSNGVMLDERHASLGIQHVRNGAFAEALSSLLGDWRSYEVPRIACGMIGSRQGWIEAPYRECPVAVADLARDTTPSPDGEIVVVSGLSCRDSMGVPDVMRGEETQVVGLLEGLAADTLIVQPGTHSKWTHVGRGPDGGATIESFATYMTGEVFAVLREHSILGRLMNQDDAFNPDAFDRGARHGLASTVGGDVLHKIFAARTLILFNELAPAAASDFLSGVLIGSEVAAGMQWSGLATRDVPVWLAGGAALSARYVYALALAGVEAHLAPEHVAAQGLWRLAVHAGLVPQPPH